MEKVADVFEIEFYIFLTCTNSVILIPAVNRVGKEMIADLFQSLHQLNGELVGEVTTQLAQLMMCQRVVGESVVVLEEE